MNIKHNLSRLVAAALTLAALTPTVGRAAEAEPSPAATPAAEPSPEGAVALPEGLDRTLTFPKEPARLFNEWLNIYLTYGTFFTFPAADNAGIRLKTDDRGNATSFVIVDADGNALTKSISTTDLDRIEIESRLPDIYITTDDGITDVNDKATVHPGKITVVAHGDPAFTEMTDAPPQRAARARQLHPRISQKTLQNTI